MTKLNLNIGCDSAKTKVNTNDATLEIEVEGVEEDEFIGEVLDNVNIERLLMQVDPESLSAEIQRRLDED